MFSKLLRKLSGVIFCEIAIGLCLMAAAPCAVAAQAKDGVSFLQIEQIRANVPEIRIYVRGASENGEFEAYLDGDPLTSAGETPLNENGTSYLVMLDISGSICADFFAVAKTEIERIARNFELGDEMTLITFGDTVEMKVANCTNVDEISDVLGLLEAKDKTTCLYDALEKGVRYAQTTAGEKRQIVLVISDGIQDTGSAGVTQKEAEDQLSWAGMPVFAFCADTATAQAQEELGAFARSTGGEIRTFDPADAADVWAEWAAELKQVRCFAFKGDDNRADGELHTILLNETSAQQQKSDTRQIRITNRTADATPPEVVALVYDQVNGRIEIEFSEAVLGADNPSAYTILRKKKEWNVTDVVKKDKTHYQLNLPEGLGFGSYKITLLGICDDSTEKNALEQNAFSFDKPFGWSDARWFVLGGCLCCVAVLGIVLIRRHRRKPKEITYKLQHVELAPGQAIPSVDNGAGLVKLCLELVDGQQAGRQIECSVEKSMILGRSKEMCDLSFADVRISKQHCVLEEQGGNLFLSDLGSSNGTYVNQVRVQKKCAIRAGDTIRIGNTTLRVVRIAQ